VTPPERRQSHPSTEISKHKNLWGPHGLGFNIGELNKVVFFPTVVLMLTTQMCNYISALERIEHNWDRGVVW
jgi:hypothetical protein